MSKVYVITEGSYSDYRIFAIYSTRELAESAEKVLSKMTSELNDIEEYELDDIPSKGKRWEVEIDMATGEIVWEREKDATVWLSEVIPKTDYRWNHPHTECTITATSTRGRDVAYKAALDKRNQMQAEREGIA